MIGVYYLWDGAAVLYVGASKNVEKRIKQHAANRQIDFCGYFCDECEESSLAANEAKAIAEFKPPYNASSFSHHHLWSDERPQ